MAAPSILEEEWRLGAVWVVRNLEQRVPLESCFCPGGSPFIRTMATEMELGGGRQVISQ